MLRLSISDSVIPVALATHLGSCSSMNLKSAVETGRIVQSGDGIFTSEAFFHELLAGYFDLKLCWVV
jgi:hypothetical protein